MQKKEASEALVLHLRAAEETFNKFRETAAGTLAAANGAAVAALVIISGTVGPRLNDDVRAFAGVLILLYFGSFLFATSALMTLYFRYRVRLDLTQEALIKIGSPSTMPPWLEKIGTSPFLALNSAAGVSRRAHARLDALVDGVMLISMLLFGGAMGGSAMGAARYLYAPQDVLHFPCYYAPEKPAMTAESCEREWRRDGSPPIGVHPRVPPVGWDPMKD